jgi:hypothetical protein
MKSRLLVALLLVALLLGMSITPPEPVQAQAEPSTLFVPLMAGGSTFQQPAQGPFVATNESDPANDIFLGFDFKTRTHPEYTDEDIDKWVDAPSPGPPGSMKYPPGITSADQLPECRDGPEFEKAQRARMEANGGHEPSPTPYQMHVVQCRPVVEWHDAAPETWDDFVDPIDAHPELFPHAPPRDKPQGALSDTASVAQTYINRWMQYDLLSPTSPDLRFGGIAADLIYAQPHFSVAGGGDWGSSDAGHFVHIFVGHNTTTTCGGQTERIQIGVGRGAWDGSAPPQANPTMVLKLFAAGQCAHGSLGASVQPLEKIALRLWRSADLRWYY